VIVRGEHTNIHDTKRLAGTGASNTHFEVGVSPSPEIANDSSRARRGGILGPLSLTKS
jgi:hypothetical protein